DSLPATRMLPIESAPNLGALYTAAKIGVR
ncbi:unnamed protein product, partial [marine sediment metagenome]